MVSKDDSSRTDQADATALASGVRILVLEAPYYPAIMEALAAGVAEVLQLQDCRYDRVAVPGALELPQALEIAADRELFSMRRGRFAGAVVLGCVIRGETTHYEIVSTNANHWLMEVALRHRIPVGNGILTVENEAQAMARASGGAAGKGGDAARACLRLIQLARSFAAGPAAAVL